MFIHSAPLKTTVEALRNDDMALTDYIGATCDRIEALDPQIQALLLEPDRKRRLLSEADRLKKQYPNPENRPPLYGLLVAVKDIFQVSGFVTKAGSQIPPELLQGQEAICVSQLKRNGALILGKSVTTEFAYFKPGPTRNPHNPAHTPGGSSSGSAAAVAAGFCPLSIGTQTIGSVIRPAAFCGVVGFKPTLNRIPTTGLLYFSRTADQVGLFTQDVSGMELAAGVLCQAWRTIPQPDQMPVIGIPDGPYLMQAQTDGLAAFESHLSHMESIGCTVKRIPFLADIHDINAIHRTLVFAEFAREHAHLYEKYGALYGKQTADIINIGKDVGKKELIGVLVNGNRLRADIETTMNREGIDLWVSPSATGPAPDGIHATGDPIMNLPWTHAGMPVISLPAGRAQNGLPLGLQFVARFGDDERLLSWCRRIHDKSAITSGN